MRSIHYRMNFGWVKMNLLLDTHIFIWWNESSALMPQEASVLCQDLDNQLFLSLASIWELQIKQQLGKYQFRLPLQSIIEHHQTLNNLQLLPINLAHIFALQNLPMHHKDPFDRLLIAQQQIENMRLLTVDRAFAKYGLEVIQR